MDSGKSLYLGHSQKVPFTLRINPILIDVTEACLIVDSCGGLNKRNTLAMEKSPDSLRYTGPTPTVTDTLLFPVHALAAGALPRPDLCFGCPSPQDNNKSLDKPVFMDAFSWLMRNHVLFLSMFLYLSRATH